jgi:hypothetical protein
VRIEALVIFWVVVVLGVAFTWFFRPYGWLGQKLHFFGAATYSPPPWPELRQREPDRGPADPTQGL